MVREQNQCYHTSLAVTDRHTHSRMRSCSEAFKEGLKIWEQIRLFWPQLPAKGLKVFQDLEQN